MLKKIESGFLKLSRVKGERQSSVVKMMMFMRKGILLQSKVSFSFSTSRSFSTSSSRTWSREEILTALNDRLLMNRRTERLGLRRCLLACGAFLVYKFVTSRVLGTSSGTQSGGGIRRGREQ